jgi:O-antigen/teichoic acid export membrane protein
MTAENPSPGRQPPLRRRLIQGAAWMVATKWGVRLLGVVSTIVLARLLAPEDFGLAAMAIVLVSTVRILFEFGVDYAVIASDKADRSTLDTGWTLRLLQTVGAGAAMLLLVPFVHFIYNDPRVVPILLVLALASMVRGVTNIGVVLFRRELQFHREFVLEVVTKIVAIIATLIAALWLRNYWALIIGLVVSYGAEIALSYSMHPYRPRFSLAKAASIWSFSKWMLATHIGNHIATRIDRVFVGALGGPQVVGHYSIGGEIANMAGPEITAPVSRALIPGFAKLRDEPSRLDQAYLKSLAAAALVGAPCSIGLALVAPAFIPIALGPNWDAAVPVVQILCFYALLRTLVTASAVLNMVSGHIDAVAKIALVRAALTPFAVYAGFRLAGIEGVAWSKVLLVAFNFWAISWLVTTTRDISRARLVDVVWRPLVAASLMAGAVRLITGFVATGADGLVLGVQITTGAVTYALAVLGLWLGCGKPRGIERDVLEMLAARRHRSAAAGQKP